MLDFTISSDTFQNGDIMPMEMVLNAHGCQGGNISPDLNWTNVQDDAKQLALIVHDPDAPVLNGWYHWIVLNIPTTKSGFKKGEKISPPMIEAKTSFGDIEGYGGACPPIGHGIHHYNFTIYALSAPIEKSTYELSPYNIEKEVKKKAIKSSTIR